MNPSIAANPSPKQWFRIDAEGITLTSGKVEIGQGLGTALLQIAADGLSVDIRQLSLCAGDTGRCPDEIWTSASISIETGGAAVAVMARAVRTRACAAAARILNTSPDAVSVSAGQFNAPGQDRRLGYGDLAPDLDLSTPVSEEECAAPWEALDDHAGTSHSRLDLKTKLTGGGFIHDIDLPGMLHGRAVLPPRPGARLGAVDLEALKALPGVTHVVRYGDFLGLCARREEQAIAALAKAEAMAHWTGAELAPRSDVDTLLDRFTAQAAPVVVERAGEAKPLTPTHSIHATRPFIAHASIGLCCAIAQPEASGMTIWSHSQGVFPLRQALAAALGLPPQSVRVIHADGAGCYGHNGADDVTLDAALLAREAGAPVRVVWTRAQELTAAPAGPAMSVTLSAAMDDAGHITAWDHQIKSFTHLTRPGWGEGVNLSSAWRLDPPHRQAPTADPGQVPYGGAGCRNAPPIYDVPAKVDYALVRERPLRTSAVRALGAHLNVFAIESMMDDLALSRGADPLIFRKNHLKDPRAHAVLDRVAAMSDWNNRETDGTWGRGLGFARYKNTAAYCAVVADVEFETGIHVSRIWCVTDAGRLINPDGAANQIEGGILQAISFTLLEDLAWDESGFAAEGWEDYPILSCDAVPQIQTVFLQDAGNPPLGVGECTTGPTAAALGNAIRHAFDLRVCEMPLTYDRIAAAV